MFGRVPVADFREPDPVLDAEDQGQPETPGRLTGYKERHDQARFH